MALFFKGCEECGRYVSIDEQTCPKCGFDFGAHPRITPRCRIAKKNFILMTFML